MYYCWDKDEEYCRDEEGEDVGDMGLPHQDEEAIRKLRQLGYEAQVKNLLTCEYCRYWLQQYAVKMPRILDYSRVWPDEIYPRMYEPQLTWLDAPVPVTDEWLEKLRREKAFAEERVAPCACVMYPCQDNEEIFKLERDMGLYPLRHAWGHCNGEQWEPNRAGLEMMEQLRVQACGGWWKRWPI